MKRTNKINIAVFAIGILLFFISYAIDDDANLLFKNIKLKFLDVVLSPVTNFGVVLVVLFLVPFIILYRKKAKKEVCALLASLALSSFISLLLKLLFVKQRPEHIYSVGLLSSSFPSMHSTVAFASLPVLLRLKKSWFAKSSWLVIFAFFVAFSRIYFGFHYLSDVVFGSFVGYFIGVLAIKLFNNENK